MRQIPDYRKGFKKESFRRVGVSLKYFFVNMQSIFLLVNVNRGLGGCHSKTTILPFIFFNFFLNDAFDILKLSEKQ